MQEVAGSSPASSTETGRAARARVFYGEPQCPSNQLFAGAGAGVAVGGLLTLLIEDLDAQVGRARERSARADALGEAGRTSRLCGGR